MLEPNFGGDFDPWKHSARKGNSTARSSVSDQGHGKSRAIDDECSCTHCRRARRRNQRLGAASNSGLVSRHSRLPPDYDEPTNEELGIELVTGWRWFAAVAVLWAAGLLVGAVVAWLIYEIVLGVDWLVRVAP